MSQELANLIFTMLGRRINEKVRVIMWQFGNRKVFEGNLDDVLDYDQVIVDNTIIPFVGQGIAIERIELQANGKVIYTNPRAVGYFTKDTMGIINAQEEMLGYSVLRDELTKRQQKLLIKK